MNDYYPVMTIMKSITFHPSLKYASLWSTNPIATIFTAASKANIEVKTIPIISKTAS